MINETLKKMKKTNVVSSAIVQSTSSKNVVSSFKVQTGKAINVGITSQGGGYIRTLTKKETAYQTRLMN